MGGPKRDGAGPRDVLSIEMHERGLARALLRAHRGQIGRAIREGRRAPNDAQRVREQTLIAVVLHRERGYVRRSPATRRLRPSIRCYRDGVVHVWMLSWYVSVP